MAKKRSEKLQNELEKKNREILDQENQVNEEIENENGMITTTPHA